MEERNGKRKSPSIIRVQADDDDAHRQQHEHEYQQQQLQQKREEQWPKDLQSYTRVRNRLGATPDDRLSQILTNLLPRIFHKIDEVTMTRNQLRNDLRCRRQYHHHGVHVLELGRTNNNNHDENESESENENENEGGWESDHQNHNQTQMKTDLNIHEQMLEQLTGTVSHAILRLSTTTCRTESNRPPSLSLSRPPSSSPLPQSQLTLPQSRSQPQPQPQTFTLPWMNALIPLINTVSSHESQSLLTPLLRLGIKLSRRAQSYIGHTGVSSDADNDTTADADADADADTDAGIYHTYVDEMIPALLQRINRLYDHDHQVGPGLNSNSSNNVNVNVNTYANTNTTMDVDYWISCSWILIDAIAMVLEEVQMKSKILGGTNIGMGLVHDWQYEDVLISPTRHRRKKDSTKKKMMKSHNAKERYKFPAYVYECLDLMNLMNLYHVHAKAHSDPNAMNIGWMDFILDIILYWPNSNAGLSDVGFSRMKQRFVGDTRNGTSGLGHGRESSPSSHSCDYIGYLNMLKFTILRLVIDDDEHCRRKSMDSSQTPRKQTAVSTDSASDSVVVTDRALLLAILSLHTGDQNVQNYAKSVVERSLGGKRGIVTRRKDEWVYVKRSHKASLRLGLVCTLLILILGEDQAKSVLLQHVQVKHLWEDMLGTSSTTSTRAYEGKDEDGSLYIAEKGKQFVRTGLLRSHKGMHLLEFIQEYFDPTAIARTSSISSSKMMDGIRLYVDLLMALEAQPSNFEYCKFHLPLLHKAYVYVQGTNDERDDSPLSLSLHRGFLKSAMNVLRKISIPRNATTAHASPLGTQTHLDRNWNRNLLEEHRAEQRERTDRSNLNVNNRKIAYEMFGDIAKTIGTTLDIDEMVGNEKPFGLAMDMFERAAIEDDSRVHPALSVALDTVLEFYNRIHSQSKVHVATVDTEYEVTPLLLSLLCAASSHSYVSRVAVARWCKGFVAKIDPEAAAHICEYLKDDPDARVSTEAKKALRKILSLSQSQISEIKDKKDACMNINTTFLNAQNPTDLMLIKSDLDTKILAVEIESSIPTILAREVLLKCGFSVDKANKELRDDREKCIEGCGMSSRFSNMKMAVELPHTLELFTCDICYDDFIPEAGFAMACGHTYCRSCWKSYLSAKDQDGPNNLLRVTCPNHKCTERVTQEDMASLDPSIARKWQSIFLTTFIKLHNIYRDCPGPGCHMIAHTVNPSLSHRDVTCRGCETIFCFGCGAPPHQPSNCSDVKNWTIAFGNSSQLWIKERSKPCPSCAIPIEKNDGCNHMHCTQCDTHFCWLCMQPMDITGPHSCNQVNPSTSTDSNDEDEQSSHFYTSRYLAHHEDEEFSTNAFENIMRNVDVFARNHPYLQEDQWEILLDAFRTLVAARRFLKNSYIFAWGFNRRHKEIDHKEKREDILRPFILHQATLELMTERLGHMTYQRSVKEIYSSEGLAVLRSYFRGMQFHALSVRKYIHRMQLLEIVKSCNQESSREA